jgi:hypothetical protein
MADTRHSHHTSAPGNRLKELALPNGTKFLNYARTGLPIASVGATYGRSKAKKSSRHKRTMPLRIKQDCKALLLQWA